MRKLKFKLSSSEVKNSEIYVSTLQAISLKSYMKCEVLDVEVVGRTNLLNSERDSLPNRQFVTAVFHSLVFW